VAPLSVAQWGTVIRINCPFNALYRAVENKIAIWPFWRPNHPNLAFLKRFARNSKFCPFGYYSAFFNVEKNSIFKSLCLRNLSKTCNMSWNSNFESYHFDKFLKTICLRPCVRRFFPKFLFSRVSEIAVFWISKYFGNISSLPNSFRPYVSQKNCKN